jgi:hypothetical protein
LPFDLGKHANAAWLDRVADYATILKDRELIHKA